MPTVAAVRMLDPTGSGHFSFRVHYDGDSVGSSLRAIIARDGYRYAYGKFTAVLTRYWRELDPAAGIDLPDYITRFPDTASVSRSVEGYGVVIVGPDEMAASAKNPDFDPATDGNVGYLVRQDGTVETWNR